MSDELKNLLLTMNVPRHRIEKNDIRWLNRNLPIQNNKHPNFTRAWELLLKELKNEFHSP